MSKRAPLLPWSKSKWSLLWCSIRRMSNRAVPRTKFVLLKSPVSTLYEERYGGDLHVFTVSMYCNRMMSKGISIGLAIDCTALDLHLLDEEILNIDASKDGKILSTVRYWHDTNEWDDFDVDYQQLLPESDSFGADYIIPSQQIILKFINMCTLHWKKRPNTHIAVFDSRGGIGAASFLVSCFMCHKLRAPVHVAVASIQKTVQESALPGIYDENLLRYMQKTFRGRKELNVPERPKWAPEIADVEDEDDEDDSNEKNGNEKSEKNIVKEQKLIVIPPWKDEPVRGESIKHNSSSSMLPPPPKKMKNSHDSKISNIPSNSLISLAPASSKYIRAMTVVAQLTNNKINKESSTKLQNPIHPYILKCVNDSSIKPNSNTLFSLKTKTSLQNVITKYSSFIKSNQYMVTWIPAGKKVKRGLLLLLQDGIFFLSSESSSSYYNGHGCEDNIFVEIFKKGIFFPRPSKQSQPQHRTLLDGFLLIQDETTKIIFYTLDIMTLEGGIVHHKPIGKRIAYLKGGVIDPKLLWIKQQQSKGRLEEVEVLHLEFQDVKKVKEVWRSGKDMVVHKQRSSEEERVGGLLFMNMSMSDDKGGFFWIEGQGDLSFEDLTESLLS